MTSAFEPARYPETARVLKYTDGRLVTIEEAEPIYKKYGYSVFFTTGKAKATNGHADGIAIAKDLTLEITRIHPPLVWSELRLKNPVLQKLPAVYTPDGYVDIFYRCEASGALEFIACDAEGFALIETVSWSIVAPTPGYLIEGTMRDPLMLTTGQRDAVRALFAQFDERPRVADVVQRLIPAAKDIMPAPWAGTPPNLDIEAESYRPLPQIPVTEETVREAFGMMELTERNVAYAFEQLYGERFRYCKVWDSWLEWVDCQWKTEKTDLPFDAMVRMIHKLNLEMRKGPAKSSFAAGCQRIAKASRKFATLPEQWDPNVWLFNTTIGTYNLETGRMVDHVKEDYITKCANVAPSSQPRPIFDKFLDEITLGDKGLAQYLQTALGSCLSGAVQDNFLLFWYGDKGQNGKNTLSELIVWILGDYADFIPTETLMATKNQQHLTFLASLRGLRIAACSEVSEGSYWNEQRIKSLTGDARISANYMAKDPFSFDRTHKHIVLGNHRPMLRIVDPAIQARIHIVPFKAHFDQEHKDPQMGVKLRSEAPQVLQWLIEGHERWMEDGRVLKKCAAVQLETDSYFEAQSTNEVWVSECCDEGQDFEGSAKDLYHSYKAFKESRGEGVSSQTRWGEWMGQRYDKYKSHGSMHYRGIALKPLSVFQYQA